MKRRFLSTDRRGRSDVPWTRLRARRWAFSRRARFAFIRFVISLILSPLTLLAAGLADLATQDLARVLDPLPLVGVGLAQAADLGRHLPHLLAVGARHGHPVRLGLDLDLDPLGDVEEHRMEITQGKLHLIPLHLGAVAHAHDVELLGEAGRGALHGVGEQGPQQAVARALGPGVSGARDLDGSVVFDLDREPREEGLLDPPLGPLGHERPVPELHLGPLGHGNRHSSNPRHGCLSYHTWQSSSPPTRRSRAWPSVSRPCDVETIPMPRPLRTGWISSALR